MTSVPNDLSHPKRTDPTRLAQSALNGAPLSRTTLYVVLCTLLGSLLFTLVYLIEGVTRPGYNAWSQPVSVLSLGPGGWIQQLNFIVFGVILLGTVSAIRRVLKGGVGATWYPILRVITGFSYIMLGIFSQDPTYSYPPGAVIAAPTTHALIHMIFSFVSFIGAAVGIFVLARRFALEPRWRGWTAYSILTGVLMIVCVSVYGTMISQHGAIAGVFERLTGGFDSLWALFFIIHLFNIQREAAKENRQQQV